jgi:hypothetical protein
MCGGVLSIAARSDCGVSPVRTAAVMRTEAARALGDPPHLATRLRPEFLWMSVLSALSGET